MIENRLFVVFLLDALTDATPRGREENDVGHKELRNDFEIVSADELNPILQAWNFFRIL